MSLARLATACFVRSQRECAFSSLSISFVAVVGLVQEVFVYCCLSSLGLVILAAHPLVWARACLLMFAFFSSIPTGGMYLFQSRVTHTWKHISSTYCIA